MISFYLRTHKEEAYIYLCIYLNNTKIRLSTGHKINATEWNPKKQRLRETRTNPKAKLINAHLDKIALEAEQHYLRLRLHYGRVTATQLKEAITGQAAPTTFIEYYNHIQQRLIRQWGYNHAKAYRTCYRKMVEYTRATGRHITWADINKSFQADYTAWLEEQGYSANYIGLHISKLKAIMQRAYNDKIHTSTDYRQLSRQRERVYNIYLTPEEITIIKQATIPATLHRARDLFIIGCWTGLRMGDWGRLSAGNIGGDTIRIKTGKTGTWVSIPLHPYVRDIISRHNGFPPPLSNQYINRQIKEIAKLAGLSGPVTISRTQGGRKTDMIKEKWQLVSTHTARRSFATNLYRAGIPATVIMRITGHRRLDTFLSYIGLDETDGLQLLQHSELFNQPPA